SGRPRRNEDEELLEPAVFDREKIAALPRNRLQEAGVPALNLPGNIRGTDPREVPLDGELKADRLLPEPVERRILAVDDHRFVQLHGRPCLPLTSTRRSRRTTRRR